MQEKLTKRQMIMKLNPCKIDTNITANFMGEFDVADVFGSKIKCGSASKLLSTLKQLGADIEGITYEDPFWYLGSKIVEDIIEDDLVEEIVETPLEDTLIEEVTTKEENTVDWEFIASLSNTKTDKIKLDEYAMLFNVKLNQSNTIKNMVKDFKKQLA